MVEIFARRDEERDKNGETTVKWRDSDRVAEYSVRGCHWGVGGTCI